MAQTDRNGAFNGPQTPPESVQVALAAALVAQAAAEAAAANAVANLPVGVHAATSKATPVDADELALVDSAAAYGLKKLTWANLKATLAGALASLSGATFSGAINEARGSVAMHATTMDLWAQPNTIDGTGSAVTITAIANAPQGGARRTLYPITGTTITNGATFAVDGAANYTTQAGDALEFEAITASTYKVHITKKDGGIVATTSAVTVATDDKVLIKDTSNSDKLETVTVQSIVDLAGADTLGSPVTLTTQTSVDFTSIPATVKEIVFEFSGVSVNAGTNLMLQIGDSGGIETTGYLGAASTVLAPVAANFTTGFGISADTAAASVYHGRYVLNLLDSATNLWVGSGSLGLSNGTQVVVSGGSKSLSAPLDRVRLTTVSGTAQLDAGTVNIKY